MLWRLVFLLAIASGAGGADAATLDNPSAAIVVDGDTIEVGGETVRLYGIDAPELGQFCLKGSNRYRCGYEAALILGKVIGTTPVTCQPTPVDAEDDGQICSAGLVDLAEAVVQQGYAMTRPSSLTVYRRAEHDAQLAKLGIWRGDFVPPAEWREGRRLPVEDDQPQQFCEVKGIESDLGEKVYFVPYDREYEALELDESRGEAMFCSDDHAEVAGWRRWPKSAVQRRRSASDRDPD